jgi:hypothetical protein
MAIDSESTDANDGSATANLPAPGKRSPAKSLVFALSSVALAAVCLVLALQYFVAERLPELTEATLQVAMERWSQHGPADYDMDIELRGARPGNVHVEVRKGEVTAQTRDGRIPGRWIWDTWSVPGMLDTLSQDIATAENPEQMVEAPKGTVWRLRCEFDPKFGVPIAYHRLVTGGPEVFWRVTTFEPK